MRCVAAECRNVQWRMPEVDESSVKRLASHRQHSAHRIVPRSCLRRSVVVVWNAVRAVLVGRPAVRKLCSQGFLSNVEELRLDDA